MTISMIAAAGENNVIGKDKGMVWHLPKDLKYFKSKTMGHHVIMGRKTYESMGKLAGRTYIIITRNKNYKAEGCYVVHSLQDALERVKNDEEPFIVGGAEIYRQAMPLAERIYLTRIHHSFEGDAFFPEIDKDNWELVSREDHQPDEKNKYALSFLVYEKK